MTGRSARHDLASIARARPRTRDLVAVVSLVAVVAALYLATASHGPAQVNDTRAATVSAWSLGTQGTLVLPDGWPASANYWGVATDAAAGAVTGDDRVLIGRFPGVAVWAAPAYALDARIGSGEPPAHPLLIDPTPAAVTAALTTAAAVGVLFGLLRTEVGRRTAWLGALVAGTGTALWSVAADAMWPHGPAVLALGGMLLAWRRGRRLVAAACAVVAVLVRPHTVVAVLVLAAHAGWQARRTGEGARDAVGLMVGAALGLVCVSLYSAWGFGTWLPVAGYDPVSHLDGLAIHSPWQTVRELGLAFVGASRGMLVWSPVLVPALGATAIAWRRLPVWTRASAIAGLVLLVVQVRAVGHRGGADLATYRVSLEALLLAAPALVLATVEVARGRRWVQALVGVTAAASIALHAHGAVVGGIEPERVEAWERIDARVVSRYGDARLGEVDLRP